MMNAIGVSNFMPESSSRDCFVDAVQVFVVIDELRCQFECEADFLCNVGLIANKKLPLNLQNERSELM